jgi:DNA polymerase-1
VTGNFRQVVVADFEYEVSDGDLPNPLCMVGYVLGEHLQHIDTIRLWRDDFSAKPPFDVSSDTLFCAYSAWAELQCFMVLGWKFQAHVYDLHTAYLASSNILLPHDPDEKRAKPRKRLPDACRAYGIEGWERIEKDVIAKDIGEGRWRQHGREAVITYCEEDVRSSSELLRRQLQGRGRLRPVSVPHVLHWSNYSAKAITQIQARGMPIDMRLWNMVQENKQAVVKEWLGQFDPSQGDEVPIYTPEGQWSYSRFEAWLARNEVIAWPRLPSGQLDTDGDAFRLMYHVPGIEGLHALRDSLRVVTGAKLPIGKDGRNRPSLFPFGTATGRNAHSKSLYNLHAGVRSFMVFNPEKIGLYLDWRTQEVGVAAALSGDEALMASYAASDVYHGFAFDAGLTKDPDRKRWAKENKEQRQKMKALQLGINYGMGVPSLAKGLDRHPLIASMLIELHRSKYTKFWTWRDQQVVDSMLARRIETEFGWPLQVTTSPNVRTLYNFPMQSHGAEMLRLAAVRLCEIGLVPNMLIHDGILLEVDDEEQVEAAKEVMRWAGMQVCGGLTIDADIDQKLIGGARYRDKRPVAGKMWDAMVTALRNVGDKLWLNGIR